MAAGVSSSQVYHYFKDKKALVQAVIEYHDETVVGGQELPRPDRPGPPGPTGSALPRRASPRPRPLRPAGSSGR